MCIAVFCQDDKSKPGNTYNLWVCWQDDCKISKPIGTYVFRVSSGNLPSNSRYFAMQHLLVHQYLAYMWVKSLWLIVGAHKFPSIPISQSLNNQFFLNTFFVSSHIIIYPENPERTQVIIGSINMGYISNTARNRTHNLFSPKRGGIHNH